MVLSHNMPPAESVSAELRFEQNSLDSNWFDGVMLTLASFPEPVLVVDHHGRLLDCNVAAQGLLGLGHEIGEGTATDLIRLSSGPAAGSWIDLCMQKGAIMGIPVIVHTQQGQEIPMTISANLV
jgi:PAS domain-containing protein